MPRSSAAPSAPSRPTHPPVPVPPCSRSCTDYGWAWNAAVLYGQQINATGDIEFVALPLRGACPWAGAGTLAGSSSLYSDWDYMNSSDVIVHETGHNLGLHHSGYNGTEYGDLSSAMSAAHNRQGLCYTSPQQIYLGCEWVGGGRAWPEGAPARARAPTQQQPASPRPPRPCVSAGQTPAWSVNVAKMLPGTVLDFDLPDSFTAVNAGVKVNLAGVPGEGVGDLAGATCAPRRDSTAPEGAEGVLHACCAHTRPPHPHTPMPHRLSFRELIPMGELEPGHERHELLHRPGV